MVIDDKLVNELLQKEIEKQVANAIKQQNKYIKDLIKNELYLVLVNAVSEQKDLISDRIKKEMSTVNYAEIISNKVAEELTRQITQAFQYTDACECNYDDCY